MKIEGDSRTEGHAILKSLSNKEGMQLGQRWNQSLGKVRSNIS